MLNESQLFKVSKILQDGYYGSFMSAIGCALQLADSGNKERLYTAFGDTFERIYAHALEAERIESSRLSEDQIESYVEKRMNQLDKKLMQGHITQAEYDEQVSIIDKWAIQQAKA